MDKMFYKAARMHDSGQNILTLPQSGQTQVGPLLIPHMFSLRQLSQIWKPHGQFQQKGSSLPQQKHLYELFLPQWDLLLGCFPEKFRGVVEFLSLSAIYSS